MPNVDIKKWQYPLWLIVHVDFKNVACQIQKVSHVMSPIFLPLSISFMRYVGFKGLLHYPLFHAQFLFFSGFSCVFTRAFDTNILVSKTQVKTCEKRKKNARIITNANPSFYMTLCIG